MPVARALDPYVEGYAVATLEEGRILRRHGITKPVLVLGVTHPDLYGELIRWDIRPAIFTAGQARQLSQLAAAAGTQAKIHLGGGHRDEPDRDATGPGIRGHGGRDQLSSRHCDEGCLPTLHGRTSGIRRRRMDQLAAYMPVCGIFYRSEESGFT